MISDSTSQALLKREVLARPYCQSGILLSVVGRNVFLKLRKLGRGPGKLGTPILKWIWNGRCLVVNEEGGVRVLPVSSGSGREFMDEGQMSIAYTPRGRFVVYDKTVGWERPPFTSMYYPNYISGGVAIHGYRSVPTQPASHGCIRVPLFAARELSKLMKLGTIVLVYDQLSFVSGKSWAENPELRQAALVNSTSRDYTYRRAGANTTARPVVIRKARSKSIRSGY